ncbi:MAG: right-handed parallel beta-helix repeat-containing protein [Opitutales bacterium]
MNNDETILDDGNGDEGPLGLQPGTMLGQYEVERLLGRGGMGAVYAVRHQVLNRVFALKVLHKEVLQSGNGPDRFKREAQVMAGLEHPAILRVDDFGEAQGLTWLRMPLVEGVTREQAPGQRLITLKDQMALGPMAEDEVRDTLKALLEGLAYAHEKGVVHRDLKPDNILLTEGGPLISDFGLVKLADSQWLKSQVELSITQSLTMDDMKTRADDSGSVPGSSTRAMMGTYAFMSPEQKKGEELDARSDLYTLGQMAYLMLTGEQVMGREPVAQLRDDLQADWDPWINKLTSLRKENRYGSAREALEALPRTATAQAPVKAPKTTKPKKQQPPKPPREPGSGKKAVLLGLAAVVVVAGLGVGGWFWMQHRQEQEAEARRIVAELAVEAEAIDNQISRSGDRVVFLQAPDGLPDDAVQAVRDAQQAGRRAFGQWLDRTWTRHPARIALTTSQEMLAAGRTGGAIKETQRAVKAFKVFETERKAERRELLEAPVMAALVDGFTSGEDRDFSPWFGLADDMVETASLVVPDQYATIQEALDAASAGDWILIRTGDYREALVIDKAVRLIGMGGSTRIAADLADAIRRPIPKNSTPWTDAAEVACTLLIEKVEGVVLTALTVQQWDTEWGRGRETDDLWETALVILEAEARLESVSVRSDVEDGLGVIQSRLTATRFGAAENVDSGAWLLGPDLEATILDSQFTRNNRGLAAYGQKDLTLAGVTIRENREGGLFAGPEGLLTVSDSTFEDNGSHGLLLNGFRLGEDRVDSDSIPEPLTVSINGTDISQPENYAISADGNMTLKLAGGTIRGGAGIAANALFFYYSEEQRKAFAEGFQAARNAERTLTPYSLADQVSYPPVGDGEWTVLDPVETYRTPVSIQITDTRFDVAGHALAAGRLVEADIRNSIIQRNSDPNQGRREGILFVGDQLALSEVTVDGFDGDGLRVSSFSGDRFVYIPLPEISVQDSRFLNGDGAGLRAEMASLSLKNSVFENNKGGGAIVKTAWDRGGSTTRIVGNTFTGNEGDGLNLNGSWRDLTGNRFTDNQYQGLELLADGFRDWDEPPELRVDDNLATGNDDGFRVGARNQARVRLTRLFARQNQINGIELSAFRSATDTLGSVVVADSETAENENYGFEIRLEGDVQILGNSVRDNKKYGIRISGNDTRPTISRNTIQGSEYGIQIEYGGDGVIDGNTISGNSKDGIIVYNSGSTPLITKNSIEDNEDEGVEITKGAYVTVRENTFAGNGGHAMLAGYPGTFGVFQDNEIKNTGKGDKKADGAFVFNDATALISGNRIRASSSDGIVVTSTAIGTVIRDNTVENAQDYGIWIGSSNGTRVADNRVNNSGRSGIIIRGDEAPVAKQVELRGNSVSTSKEDGILVTGARASARIIGDQVTGAGQFGIHFADGFGLVEGGAFSGVDAAIEAHGSTGGALVREARLSGKTGLLSTTGANILYQNIDTRSVTGQTTAVANGGTVSRAP